MWYCQVAALHLSLSLRGQAGLCLLRCLQQQEALQGEDTSAVIVLSGREREGDSGERRGRVRGREKLRSLAHWNRSFTLAVDGWAVGRGRELGSLCQAEGRAEHEHNENLPSLAFRYRPEEDAGEEGWKADVVPETEGHYRVFRKWEHQSLSLLFLCMCSAL